MRRTAAAIAHWLLLGTVVLCMTKLATTETANAQGVERPVSYRLPWHRTGQFLMAILVAIVTRLIHLSRLEMKRGCIFHYT